MVDCFSALQSSEAYDEALAEVSALIDLDPAPETPAGKRLNRLVAVIEDYERIHYPM